MLHLPDAYDLKRFYNSLRGQMARDQLRLQVKNIWPDLKNYNVIGFGYPMPYLRSYLESAKRVICLMPSQLGVHNWPADQKNRVCLCPENLLPLETNTVDRILVVHALEFLDKPEHTFEELWRILKSNGRLIVVVPNRMGLWARMDNTPFGQGRPYSAGQVEDFLKANLFVHERTCHALFIPPFNKTYLFKGAHIFEKLGALLCPALGGVYMIEVTKQIYAGTGRAVPAYAARKKGTVTAKPVPSPRT
jgi:SAM-dependent methyltransferase